MPCYRCGARQTDPVRGASPWKRAVRHDEQVLVCPDCQKLPDWTSDLDQCSTCGSTVLVCRLGEIECRECHAVLSAGGRAHDQPPQDAPGLSEEVAAALDRVLRRSGLAGDRRSLRVRDPDARDEEST